MQYEIKLGQSVRISRDDDGAEGMPGIIQQVFEGNRFQVGLPCGGFRNLRRDQIIMDAIKPEITTKHQQQWRYETDDFEGICIIAKDAMQIKFVFESVGNQFFDVLKIDEVIRLKLTIPVSVEGILDELIDAFPGATITALGRAASHGWIVATNKTK